MEAEKGRYIEEVKGSWMYVLLYVCHTWCDVEMMHLCMYVGIMFMCMCIILIS